MLKKIIITLGVAGFALVVLAPHAEARVRNSQSMSMASLGQVVESMWNTLCLFGGGMNDSVATGNTYGPGDGTGNQGDGPEDGTGYGAVAQGKGSTNIDCDQTGPKGRIHRNSR